MTIQANKMAFNNNANDKGYATKNRGYLRPVCCVISLTNNLLDNHILY